MADFTLSHRAFPEGTTVGVYPESRWLDRGAFPDGAPLGTAVDEADITGGVANFTGLTEGLVYLAYAQVGSQHVYVKFMAPGGSNVPDTKLPTAVFDAKGDLIVGFGPDAFDRLPVGANDLVLTADSNEDLGVKWAAGGGGGGGIPQTIFDAKGDLIAASGADTAARLPVGTNGEVLKAASGEATGLDWGTLAKGDVGLGNVDNTSDANKPVSSATQTALDAKEALANKDTDALLAADSDTKYPSQKAIRTFITRRFAGIWPVVEFGAVGDDTTNDTDAIQDAIDACIADGGGSVIFGHEKSYLCSSAPRTDRDGNCVLSLVDEIGSAVPVALLSTDPSGGRRAIIRGNQTGLSYSATDGPPSLIGTTTDESGSIVNYVGPVTMKGIGVSVPTDPTFAGVDLFSAGGCDLDRSYVRAAAASSTPSAIEHHAFGYRLPNGYNHGIIRLRNVTASFMYAGFVCHSPNQVQFVSAYAYENYLALGFEDPASPGPAVHSVYPGHLLVDHAPFIIAAYSADTGLTSLVNNEVYLQDLSIDYEAGTAPFAPVFTITDANSKLFGSLNMHYVSGGVASTAMGNFSGGRNLVLTNNKRSFGSIASANNFELPPFGEFFQVTGTTQINLMRAGWEGRMVTLKFNGNPLVKHNQTASGWLAPILCAGGADLTTTANDVVSFRYDGTSWHQIAPILAK